MSSSKIYNEVFISGDVETNGPIPGIYSMLSAGLAAFTLDRGVIDTFSVNLDLLPGAQVHPDTQKFWDENPVAYNLTRLNTVNPKSGIPEMCRWIKSMGKGTQPIYVGYPAGFDFSFHHWYCVQFDGDDPCGFSCLDLKSYAMASQKWGFRQSTKRNMPTAWFKKKLPHTHVAVDDATEQAWMAYYMMHDNIKD